MTGEKYKINDIATLYSREQWEKMKPLSGDETDNYILFVSNQPDGLRLDVRILRDDLSMPNGFILVINKDFEEVIVPHYLGFELMSIAGNLALLYDRDINKYRSRLLKKTLLDYSIEIPDWENQLIYADSFYFVEGLKNYLLKKKEDRYNQLRLSVFTEVMDALSLEQVMGPFFNDLGIHIFDPWKSLIEKYDKSDKQYMNKLFGELISQDNDVMNGVRKLRLAVKNITELYKKV